MKIRVVSTASRVKAVQVIQYRNYKRVVLKHIGSAKTEDELKALLLAAEEWIKEASHQLSLFPDDNPNQVFYVNHSKFVGVKYRHFHQTIRQVFDRLGLGDLPELLQDLVAIRIFEPASKLRSLELLAKYFGIHHQRKTYYKFAPKCIDLKDEVENKVVAFAQSAYDFKYDILFYDVTTLYFETFEEDELRKTGFSKDNKAQQPQILVALMVSKEGFPVSYEVFAGNTFEGHTIIPVIQKFISKNKVKNFTVVADAAMISAENIRLLNSNQINYIVGARLGNVSPLLLEQIDKTMRREDGHTIRLKTENGYLICSYSKVRYRKDKHEMDKQLEKAKLIARQPSKGKRVKFISTKDAKISLNEPLIEKTTKLLGIKGYYTNIGESEIDNSTIIARYHDLYKIEQSFRITKNDLQTRPVFHFKEQPIKLHLLICFIALVISKHIELKAGCSIRKFIDESKKIVDGEILNITTGKIIKIKAKTTQTMDGYIEKIISPH
ncbi:MAG: IS1634 family transposase [Flammeovirgaceae bacterium]|nr:IS1634 family transposase [Flammeovirgaceae bacterium]